MITDELRAIWAEIPDIKCKGLCQESCGPIGMSIAEDLELQKRGVVIPRWGDAMADLDHYNCPALVDGRCSVYDVRPTLCRLWGAVEPMKCPWGCAGPDEVLPGPECADILNRATDAGGGLQDRFWSPK